MLRWLLLVLVSLGSVPAVAADAVPTVQEKLHYLGDYSLALGRKFGCDGKGDQMVFDIKRYTYVLQFDDADGPAAQDVAKKNLTAGIAETKSDKQSCPSAVAQASAEEDKGRNDRQVMQAASHNVGVVSGAALACGVPDTDVQQMLQRALQYTRIDSDAAKADIAAWQTEGRQEVASNKIGCDAVKTIFGQVNSIFTP